MKKETIVKSLLGFGVLALIVGVSVSHAEDIARVLQPKVVVMGNYIEAAGSANSKSDGDVVLGSTQTNATFATAGSVTNQGGLYLYDTESNSGLEVQGFAHFDTSSQAFFMGTTTFSGPIVGGTITSTLSSLTVNGTSTLNGALTVSGKTTLATTSIAVPLCLRDGTNNYYVKIAPSTTAANVVFTTSTSCN